MKRIRFTRDALYEVEGYQKGVTYKDGSVHDFEDHFADRWLRRDAAVEVNTREPMPEDPPAPEEIEQAVEVIEQAAESARTTTAKILRRK